MYVACGNASTSNSIETTRNDIAEAAPISASGAQRGSRPPIIRREANTTDRIIAMYAASPTRPISIVRCRNSESRIR